MKCTIVYCNITTHITLHMITGAWDGSITLNIHHPAHVIMRLGGISADQGQRFVEYVHYFKAAIDGLVNRSRQQ